MIQLHILGVQLTIRSGQENDRRFYFLEQLCQTHAIPSLPFVWNADSWTKSELYSSVCVEQLTQIWPKNWTVDLRRWEKFDPRRKSFI